MQTIFISHSDVNVCAPALQPAVEALRRGALVVFPTETVYGVAANAAMADAISRLHAVKANDDRRPFTVHLPDAREAHRYVREPSHVLRRFARKGWPGPLTLVAEEPHPEQTGIAQACPPEQLTAIYHEGRVGLRCPAHPVAARLLADVKVPVVASSANTKGAPPPTDCESAVRNLGEHIEFAIDGGRSRFAGASTVVLVQGEQWSVQREGAIDRRTLERWAQTNVLFICTGNSCRSPLAEYLYRRELAMALRGSDAALAGLGYSVASAGVAAFPGGPISEGSRTELAQRGIEAGEHRSQPLTIELIQNAERIYVMSPEHRDATIRMVPGAAGRTELLDPRGPIADPIGGGPAAYAECARQIENCIRLRVRELLDENLNW